MAVPAMVATAAVMSAFAAGASPMMMATAIVVPATSAMMLMPAATITAIPVAEPLIIAAMVVAVAVTVICVVVTGVIGTGVDARMVVNASRRASDNSKQADQEKVPHRVLHAVHELITQE
jgi:hypothetical protein